METESALTVYIHSATSMGITYLFSVFQTPVTSDGAKSKLEYGGATRLQSGFADNNIQAGPQKVSRLPKSQKTLSIKSY